MQVNFAEFNLACTGFGGNQEAIATAMAMNNQQPGQFTAALHSRSATKPTGRTGGF